MKLLIYSDLHLEFGTDFKPPVDTDADVMILAGDITIFSKNKLNKLSRFLEGWDKPVLYIAGNHEYYTKKCMKRVKGSFKKWAATKHPNLIFLDDEEITIGDVNFFGGTMWTDLNNSNPMSIWDASQHMNDYYYIYRGEVPIIPEYTVVLHNIYVNKLKSWFEKEPLGKRVVISHHSPVWYRTSPHYDIRVKAVYHALDTEDLIHQYKPTLWIFGHTHDPFDEIIGDTRIISNPRGYPFSGGGCECRDFDPRGKEIVV